MAKTVKTTYSCDRCGGNAAYTACHGDPPHAEAYFSLGLYGAGNPTRATFNDLCRNCHDELKKWISAKRA